MFTAKWCVTSWPELRMLLAQANLFIVALVLVALFVLFICMCVVLIYGKLWFRAYMSGVKVSLLQLIGMTSRKTNARLVVDAMVLAHLSGITLACDEVEKAYLQGADIPKIVRALIKAKKDGETDFSFQQLVDFDVQMKSPDSRI